MQTKRSKLYFRIKSFHNCSELKTRHFYIRLTELNNKNRTEEKRFSNKFPFDLELTTYTGKYPGIIVTIRYKKESSHELLDEFAIPYKLIPFQRNVQFQRIFVPPNADLVGKLNYPEMTFVIDDHPFNPDADSSIDLYKTASTLGYDHTCIGTPFSNITTPVDQSLKNNDDVKNDYLNIVTHYKKNRDEMFPKTKKRYQPLPSIDLNNKKTITDTYEKLFTVISREDVGASSAENEANVILCLMREDKVATFEGMLEDGFQEIPIQESKSGLNYFFDFNYE